MQSTSIAGRLPYLFLVLVPAALPQAQVRSLDGVGLDDVVTAVLAYSPEIERGRLAVEAEAGALLVAASPFDLQVRAGLLRGRETLPLGSGRNGLLVTESVETSTSVVKSFRSGIAVASDLSLGRVGSGADTVPADRIRSLVSLSVPLASGRGGGATAGVERAARESYVASRYERDHVVARAVHDAVRAYWLYLAAHEQLETHVESADRARRLVEETEVLIRADERPPSDLDLMASNYALKQTAVTAARQTLLDARHALGIAMGLGADAIPSLGPPETAFPNTSIDSRVPFASTGRAGIVRTALSARRDLAGLHARRAGARLAWEGALQDVRPRWDLLASLGYTWVSQRPVAEGPSALHQAFGGVSGLVQIQYEPLANNRAVQGRARRAAALEQAAAVAADDLVRRIEANVRVAAERFDNAVKEAQAAREAVRLSERSVVTEQEKFRLGLATLFDAILAEDALTNARLRHTNARFRVAAALVGLRFESATLLETSGGVVSADPERMTSFVFEERKP